MAIAKRWPHLLICGPAGHIAAPLPSPLHEIFVMWSRHPATGCNRETGGGGQGGNPQPQHNRNTILTSPHFIVVCRRKRQGPCHRRIASAKHNDLGEAGLGPPGQTPTAGFGRAVAGLFGPHLVEQQPAPLPVGEPVSVRLCFIGVWGVQTPGGAVVLARVGRELRKKAEMETGLSASAEGRSLIPQAECNKA